MKIAGYRIHRYSLPLRKPLRFGGAVVEERRGALIEVNDADRREAWGEVAPLPGFSPETLDEAVLQLAERMRELRRARCSAADILDGRLTGDTASSVRFGIETACLALAGAEEDAPWPAALGHPEGTQVPVCRLIADPDPDAADAAAQAAAEGFRCIKLKVGRGVLEEERTLVREVAARLPEGCLLRLDANRAWRLDDARAFCTGLAGLPVEFVEEPLAERGDWEALAADAPVDTAIDESLAAGGGELLRSEAGPRWVVLKPTLIGGVSGALGWARAARAASRRVVISAMYESGVGLRMLGRLAATLQAPAVAAGLDTARAFAEDVVSNPARIEQGAVPLRALDEAPRVRRGMLEEIDGG